MREESWEDLLPRTAQRLANEAPEAGALDPADGAHVRVEPRWDVHAFGGCLHAMLTRREFDRSQLAELLPIPGAPTDNATRKLKLMIGKLALSLAVESTLRSWSLFGYEGRHSDPW